VYYHGWSATKRRKRLLQGDVEDYVKQVLMEIAEEKRIGLLEHETVVDHVHMLLNVDSMDSQSQIMNYLKGVPTRKVFLRFPDLQLDAGTNHFWEKGYGDGTLEQVEVTKISRYIRTQKERLDGFER
jgi:putative transposase